jgi:p24 family protein alpha
LEIIVAKPALGHYEAHQLNAQTQQFELDPNMGVTITVDETFDNDHRIVNQRGASKGRFTFSAADSGEHKLCFQPTNVAHSGGWLIGGQDVGGVKMILDMVIGETSKIESTDKGKVEDLVSKVKDLNGRLQDIRREQVFQRVRIHLRQLLD